MTFESGGDERGIERRRARIRIVHRARKTTPCSVASRRRRAELGRAARDATAAASSRAGMFADRADGALEVSDEVRRVAPAPRGSALRMRRARSSSAWRSTAAGRETARARHSSVR